MAILMEESLSLRQGCVAGNGAGSGAGGMSAWTGGLSACSGLCNTVLLLHLFLPPPPSQCIFMEEPDGTTVYYSFTTDQPRRTCLCTLLLHC